MNVYIITVRSVTYAQKLVNILVGMKIKAKIIKRPKGLTVGGCGYAVEVRIDSPAIVKTVLNQNGFPDFGVYQKGEKGYDIL